MDWTGCVPGHAAPTVLSGCEGMGPAKHAKRRERGETCGLGAHVTSRDPTLDAVGTRSCAIRQACPKSVQLRYLTCPSELVKEWGPRNTRKDAKGMRRVGWEPMSHRATRHWMR